MPHHKTADDVNDLHGSEEDDKNLFDILSEDAANHPACCDSRRYREWETTVVEPELSKLGFSAKNWRTTDGDSFGPLVRAVDLTRDGKTETYFYG